MRIRFAKQGDLRFSSHRDLLRVMERLFRRAEVAVRQSEGFHPKPRFMFPSALALGITGQDEVFDVDLLRAWEPAELIARLAAEAPPGLTLLAAEVVPPGRRKLRPAGCATNCLCRSSAWPRPAGRRSGERRRQSAGPARRARGGGRSPGDLGRADDREGVLRMTLRAIRTAQARPRDILEVLELADLEFSGALVRSRVELCDQLEPRDGSPTNT